ncbi:MAG TPA: efflux RND transporter permease subunit, partial [Steroidobacteraceae bacterium]|nr:efflux RND transporter permease subunit [Steroidobacteraceae bacterium]
VGGFLFMKLPGSFLPEEDQGYGLIDLQLSPGASLQRTLDVLQQLDGELKKNPAVSFTFLIAGSSFTGAGENVGRAFVHLKPWNERSTTAADFIAWAAATLPSKLRDARISVFNLPTIRGLGQFGGFDFFLEDRAGLGREALTRAQDTVLREAGRDTTLTGVRLNTLDPAPQLRLTVDRVQAQSMGLSVSDVYTAIQLMLAPVYADDFLYEGRVLRVLLQADAAYRMSPEALGHFYVIGANNAMIPLSAVVRTDWLVASPSLTRYNGYPAVEITGSNAPGRSSGEAMQAMEQIVSRKLPHTIGYDWAGQSLQELLSGAQAPMLFALSILVVYLCLAALYESWSVPAAVLMAVPVGLIGSTVAALLRGMPNDVFFKVGLITIIGLSAKNAILIVEFAVTLRRAGKSLHEAVLEAARLRFRPILMTSFAFILGVFPMAVSSGAGANARRAIGTAVVGGMLSAALLGVLLIPVCFVAVRRLMGDKLDEPSPQPMAPQPSGHS